jgi:hypothetical protein
MIRDKKELRTFLAALRDGSNGTMTADDFKTAIAKVGLTQEASGEFFGKYKRLGQGWATGERPVPFLVQHCLEFMVANEIQASHFEA